MALSYYFQDVEEEHFEQTGDAVKSSDMDAKKMKMSELAARLLDFETMGFLAFAADFTFVLNIYMKKWQAPDLDMDKYRAQVEQLIAFVETNYLGEEIKWGKRGLAFHKQFEHIPFGQEGKINWTPVRKGACRRRLAPPPSAAVRRVRRRLESDWPLAACPPAPRRSVGITSPKPPDPKNFETVSVTPEKRQALNEEVVGIARAFRTELREYFVFSPEVDALLILNGDNAPDDADASYGEAEIAILAAHFALADKNGPLFIDPEALGDEWEALSLNDLDSLKGGSPLETLDKAAYPTVYKLLCIKETTPLGNAFSESCFSTLVDIMSAKKSTMTSDTLNNRMRVVRCGPALADQEAVDRVVKKAVAIMAKRSCPGRSVGGKASGVSRAKKAAKAHTAAAEETQAELSGMNNGSAAASSGGPSSTLSMDKYTVLEQPDTELLTFVSNKARLMIYTDDGKWTEVRVQKKKQKERRTEAGGSKRSRVEFEAKVMGKSNVIWTLVLDEDAYGTTNKPGAWVQVARKK